jgi:tripartite-type tricarboxylate transporter receptor subunit TctC
MKNKFYALLGAFILSFANWSPLYAKTVIEIATPLVPGGAVDLTARAISKVLTDSGYENIVTYHPGGNGDIALNYVTQKKDNVIVVASSATFVFSNVVANRGNMWAQQNTLIGPSLTNAMVFLTSNKSMTLQDLIAQAKKETVQCGVSNAHGSIELLNINKRYGTQFEPVTYKGTGQLIPDVVGGHIACAYDQIAPYTGLREKIKFLAASRAWTDVAGIDTVLSGYRFETWYAAAIPNGSNLLKNADLVKLLAEWTQKSDTVQGLVDKSFVLTRPDKNLSQRAQQESDFYLTVIKR